MDLILNYLFLYVILSQDVTQDFRNILYTYMDVDVWYLSLYFRYTAVHAAFKQSNVYKPRSSKCTFVELKINQNDCISRARTNCNLIIL